MNSSFLVITDHHLGTDRYSVNRGYSTAWALERVLEAIASERRHGAQFLLCTGDVADAGLDEEYTFARQLFGIEPGKQAPGPVSSSRAGLSELPLYIVPGNHDPREVWTRNLFPATPPADSLDLQWRVGELSFVYLDTGIGSRAGVLSDASLNFLDSALDQGAPTVLVLHHHPVEVGIPWLDSALPETVDRLWDRLSDSPVLAVLFGHTHASVDHVVRGVPVMGTRSTCFQFAATEEPAFLIQPLHYRLVSIDDAGVRTSLYEVPLAGAARARLVT